MVSSPRAWAQHLRKFLLSFGLIQCDSADHGLFKFMWNNKCVIRMVVVVDDCLVAYSKEHTEVYNSFIAALKKFAQHTIEQPNVFVNLYLIRDRNARKIYVHQYYSVRKVVDQYAPDGYTRDTPADSTDSVSKSDCPSPGSSDEIYMKTQSFREILGFSFILQYARGLIFWSFVLCCQQWRKILVASICTCYIMFFVICLNIRHTLFASGKNQISHCKSIPTLLGLQIPSIFHPLFLFQRNKSN